jgi:transcription elongation factor Elf1
MATGYDVARVTEETCPRCGSNMALHTAVDLRGKDAVYVLKCTNRHCGFRKVKDVFRVVYAA